MTVREIMHLQTWHTYSVASLPKKKPTLSHHVHFLEKACFNQQCPDETVPRRKRNKKSKGAQSPNNRQQP